MAKWGTPITRNMSVESVEFCFFQWHLYLMHEGDSWDVIKLSKTCGCGTHIFLLRLHGNFYSAVTEICCRRKQNMKMTNNDFTHIIINRALKPIYNIKILDVWMLRKTEHANRLVKNIIIVMEKSTGSRTFIARAMYVLLNSRIVAEWGGKKPCYQFVMFYYIINIFTFFPLLQSQFNYCCWHVFSPIFFIFFSAIPATSVFRCADAAGQM